MKRHPIVYTAVGLLLLAVATVIYALGQESARTPAFSLHHYPAAVALDEAGKHAEAVTEFTKAIEFNPRHPAPRHGRAIAYMHLGAYDEALADLNDAIRLDPGYALGYNTRGVVRMAQKQYDAALEDLKHAQQLKPALSDARINQAKVYIQLRRYDEAIKIYDAMIEEGTETAVAYNNRFWLTYAVGQGVVPQDEVQAVAWLRKAAAQGNAEAQFNLGNAYAKGQGVPQDYAEAHTWYHLAASRVVGADQVNYGKARDDLARVMTPEQIVDAQRRARVWQDAFEKKK